MTRATRLHAARQSLGLSLSEMAEALGLRGTQAKDDLRKMEEGARPVTGPVLVAAELMAERAHVIAHVKDLDKGAARALAAVVLAAGGRVEVTPAIARKLGKITLVQTPDLDTGAIIYEASVE